MADHNQVGADLPCITGNLLDGIPDQHLAGSSLARVGKLLQAFGKDFLIPLSFRFRVRSAVVEGAINRNVDEREA